MITKGAKLTLKRIPLECIQIKEFQQRYPAKLNTYIQLMTDFPEDDPGILHVTPSDTHAGMYALLDGHHKYCAAIMTGREDALCLIVEEGRQLDLSAELEEGMQRARSANYATAKTR